MKIKLQNYSLISNDLIEAEIKLTKEWLDKNPYSDFNAGRLDVLEDLKKALIPSEKLVELCLDKIIETMPPALAIHYLEYKKDFIKSEI